MKRILALIMAGVMIFALVACTSTKPEQTDEPIDALSPEVEAPAEDATDAEEAPEQTEEVKDEAPSEEKKPEDTPSAKPADKVETKPEVKPETKPEVKPEPAPETTPEAKPEPPVEPEAPEAPSEDKAEAPSGATMGDTMLAVFRANRDKSVDDIANACISDKSIQFFGMTASVEEGFFAEFDGDVKGFSKCVKFGPAMGSIAFSGLVFEVTGDADTFAADLKSRANPRWNICVEAEQTICEVYGNKVFFLMCPKSLGE